MGNINSYFWILTAKYWYTKVGRLWMWSFWNSNYNYQTFDWVHCFHYTRCLAVFLTCAPNLKECPYGRYRPILHYEHGTKLNVFFRQTSSMRLSIKVYCSKSNYTTEIQFRACVNDGDTLWKNVIKHILTNFNVVYHISQKPVNECNLVMT